MGHGAYGLAAVAVGSLPPQDPYRHTTQAPYASDAPQAGPLANDQAITDPRRGGQWVGMDKQVGLPSAPAGHCQLHAAPATTALASCISHMKPKHAPSCHLLLTSLPATGSALGAGSCITPLLQARLLPPPPGPDHYIVLRGPTTRPRIRAAAAGACLHAPFTGCNL